MVGVHRRVRRTSSGRSVQNYFRDYDPALGRYVQPDPIGLQGGLNPYLYANGNPLAYMDPYGLWALGDPIDQRIVDAVTGFGDAFLIPELIRDAFDFGTVDKCSAAYRGGKITGVIWGAVPFAARTAAAVGATRFGQVLNANRYFRIGPGRWGKDMVPRISSPYLWGDGHYSLTTRLPMLPPAGVASNPDCGCER
jgi:RHS repeat-associated protein